MPGWLIQLLRWGGIAVAVVFAAALIWIEYSAGPTPAAGEVQAAGSAAPTTLYWVLLAVGIVAAVIGFTLRQRKPGAQ